MSWEAWGSDDPPNRWEDTAICQDFQKILAAYRKWLATYRSEMPGPEFDVATEEVDKKLDEISLMMEGQIDA